MMDYGKRPPLDEQKSLWQASVAREGVTTGAGAAAGNSIIDAGLIGIGANSFISMLMIVYPGEPTNVDSMDITAFNNATGEVTLAKAYKGIAAAIPAGVPYKIVTFRFVPAEVAALEAKLDRLAGAEDVGTHAHTSNTNWQEVVEVTTTARKKLLGIWLDFNLLAQNMNMRMSCKIDGATYRIFWNDTWLSTDEDGALIATPWAFNNDIKLELQSAVAEGASKNIPYKLIYQDMQ